MTNDNLRTWPEEIYLDACYDSLDAAYETSPRKFRPGEDFEWSSEKPDNGVKYIRADLYESLERQLKFVDTVLHDITGIADRKKTDERDKLSEIRERLDELGF